MKISIELIKKHKLENTRKYRHEHPEWCAEIKHKRRATQSLLGGHFTAKEWRSLKEKYNFTCPICNNSEPTIKLTVDHVVPLKKWEVWSKENKPQYEWNSITNIQPLCGSCNSQKWMTI
jgi:5-methylcytosine-specific restriction endonuclease McrA